MAGRTAHTGMPHQRTKQKNKHFTLARHELAWLGLVAGAVVILGFLVLIFYVVANQYFQKSSLVEPSESAVQEPVIVESLNYHGHQAPSGFAPELLVGAEKELLISQELRNPQVGSLRFVSFESRIDYQTLLDYYRRYLDKNLYRQLASFGPDRTVQITARRGDMSFDFNITPLVSGSMVTIYQNVAH